jgi:hypothetical protein
LKRKHKRLMNNEAAQKEEENERRNRSEVFASIRCFAAVTACFTALTAFRGRNGVSRP